MNAGEAQSADQRQYRVAIAEDDELTREGISCVVAREKEFKICGVADDKKSTLELMEGKKPDVLLFNLFLDGCDGIDLLKDLAARFPQTRVVVTGTQNQESYAERLLHAGASAWLPRRATAHELIDALRRAVAPQPGCSRPIRHVGRSSEGPPSFSALTDRELHVFRLIGRGGGTGNIAREPA
ncbi:MAG: response regulator transcription factor [Blastocatellia bacterium]|nr:response regulator transcription factor [Blastocatellia bacterium]